MFVDDELGEFLDRASAQGLLYPYGCYVLFSYDVLMENLNDPCHFSVFIMEYVPRSVDTSQSPFMVAP